MSVGNLLAVFLCGASRRDAVTLAVVTTVLLVVALASSLLPARRATRVDPSLTLRTE
jgi:ABC-type lipoprotein release transport system permease subunit